VTPAPAPTRATPRGTPAPAPAAGAGGSRPAHPRGRAGTAFRWAGAFALLGAAFVTDTVTGSEVSSSLYYVIAVAATAWLLGRGPGLAMAVLGAAAWLAAYRLSGQRFSHPAILLWNVGAEVTIYAAMALALGFLREHVGEVRALAARLAESHRLLDREMRVVGELQRQLLPPAPPQIPGYTWSVQYETSTRAGGDYYDFVTLPDGRVGVLIADASGHGAPAAVLMAMTRTLLHAVAAGSPTPAGVLARLNCDLARLLPAGWFVTACCAFLDPRSGELVYSLAGHDPPYALRADGRAPERLAACGGPLLGPFPGAEYDTLAARLAPGDALVLYTDGLPEAADPDGRLLEREAVEAVLESVPDLRPVTIRAHVVEHVRRHRAGAAPSDDLTLLILGREA